MREHGPEMAAALGPHVRLVEYGSGSSAKTRILLDHLPCPAAYVPMDISREHLMRSAGSLAAAYPHVEVLPVCADYTQPFTLPFGLRPAARTVVYFPGSTIGNFHPAQAECFLSDMAQAAGPDGGLLIGVDLKKSRALLEPAYNDRQGVTAAFNLNLLHRINRELGGDFDLAQWEHWAFYNDRAGRIEMHLLSLREQTVRIGAETFEFAADETVWTECSYKYSLDGFAARAGRAGMGRGAGLDGRRAAFQRPVSHPEVGAWLASSLVPFAMPNSSAVSFPPLPCPLRRRARALDEAPLAGLRATLIDDVALPFPGRQVAVLLRPLGDLGLRLALVAEGAGDEQQLLGRTWHLVHHGFLLLELLT